MKSFFFIILILLGLTPMVRSQTRNNNDGLYRQGETTVPPFYAGRPLPSAGNLARVVAIPNIFQAGRRVGGSGLTFQWVKDGNPIQSASGKGKDVLEYTVDRGGAPSVVAVKIVNDKGDLLAENRATITATRPKIVLLTPKNLTTETTIFAEPFFFSPTELANRRVSFTWRINGENVGNQQENSQIFTISPPEEGSGEVKLSVIARSQVNPAQQTATAEATLSFGLSNSNF